MKKVSVKLWAQKSDVPYMSQVVEFLKSALDSNHLIFYYLQEQEMCTVCLFVDSVAFKEVSKGQ